MALLEVDGIDASYGRIRALQGVSLHVNEGEIVTLIGGNGAGKTTTLRAISGLVKPTKGAIRFAGEDVLRDTPDRIVRRGIGHSPEGRRVFARMTVRENLELGAYTRTSKTEIASDFERVLEIFPRLKERIAQKSGTLSGGEQQMLAMARALMSRPKLLMLDEPSLGLSPILVQTIFGVIREINARGTTVLLIEQNARQALGIASRGYVLEVGKIVHEDTAANLMASEAVRAAYLGGGAA
jgi:branched-chain amino acid transport system ATP-binding protein